MKNGILYSKVLLVFALLLGNAFAQDRSVEYKIKAAYLYNFTKFITWPEDDSRFFNICIVGIDPFGEIIAPIEGRTVKGRTIRLYQYDSVKKAKECQLIYFAEANNAEIISGVLTTHSLAQTLTVGDLKVFAQQGGMIAFFVKDSKIKLFINLPALRQNGLEISAKLLEVAEVYKGESND